MSPPHVAPEEANSKGLEYLAVVIERLEAEMPTPEEMAYLRNKKLADERATWAFHLIKTYAPWVISIGGSIGAGAYWLVTHFTWRSAP